MKRLLVAAGLSLTLFFASCSQAVDYNDSVVKMHSMYSQRFQSGVGVISSTEDMAKKQDAVAAIEKLTDSCNDVLSKMKPTEEATEFHAKLVAFYGAVKTDLVPVVKKMAALKEDETNVDAVNALSQEFNTATQKIVNMENDVIAAQRDFAAKANMKIK